MVGTTCRRFALAATLLATFSTVVRAEPSSGKELSPQQIAEQYPLRAKYPDCQPVSTQQLHDWVGTAIIVDVRNEVEFNVVHLKDAVNILVGPMQKSDLLAIRAADGEQPLVFYCNGTTCSKSYKATAKAMAWGFQNTFVYDAGVFDWAVNYPAEAVFFGEPMTAESAKTDLIPKSELKKISLAPSEFIERAKSGEYQVFDCRDNKERSEYAISLQGIKKLNMDQFVQFMDKKGAIPESKFLVLDNVGKQVRWLDYYLRRGGRTEYYFLDGGVRAWREAGFDKGGNK